MKRWHSLVALGWVILLPALAWSACPSVGQTRGDCDIWIDTNGDGLPGPNMAVDLNAFVTFRIYIDAKDFSFTYFQAWVSNGPNAGTQYFSRDTADIDYTTGIAGASPDPVDFFTNPTALGFTSSGFGAQAGGVRLLATVTTKAIRQTPSFQACIDPMVDPYDGYGTFSTIGQGVVFSLFCDAAIDSAGCYGIGDTATEETSWGQIKGLFH